MHWTGFSSVSVVLMEVVGRWVCPSVCCVRLSWPKIHFRRSCVSSMPEEVICQSENVGLYVSPPPLLFALIPPVSPASYSLGTISSLPFICLLFLPCPVPFFGFYFFTYNFDSDILIQKAYLELCCSGVFWTHVHINTCACALQIISSAVLYGKL